MEMEESLLSIDEEGSRRLGLDVRCEQVYYTVKLPASAPWRLGEKKTILKGINVHFEAGSMTGILGPSGGGKSTLLEVLGGFNHNRGHLQGEVVIESASGKVMRVEDCACLIPQDDVLLPGLTPRETLLFSAQLRGIELERVEIILYQLGLQDCGMTRVGSVEKRGLSGGQRKRVSIGLELLDNPGLILADEPTSGLDSKMAADVIHLLANLSSKEMRTVITTIHQPTSAMYYTFHSIVLLAKGKICFAGPPGDYTGLAPQYIPNEHSNPAEIFMEYLQDDNAVQDMISKWKCNGASSEISSTLTKSMHKNSFFSYLRLPKRRQMRTSILRQAIILGRRQFLDKLKDPENFAQSLMVKISIGFIIGGVWINQSGHKEENIFPVQGALFIVSMNSMMDTVFVTALSLTHSKALLMREYRNGYYSLFPRHVAVLFVDSFLAALASLAMGCPVYFLVGLRRDLLIFLRYMLICVLLACQGVAFGHCIGTLADADFQQVQSLVSPSLTPLILFSGYMIPQKQIPWWGKWLYDVSFFQYAMTLFQINQFRDFSFNDCSDFEREITGCYQTGGQFLRDNDMNPNQISRYFLILAAYAILLFLLSYLAYSRAIARF